MFKVFYDEWVMDYLSLYFKLYRQYFETLYEDSWIWSEEVIVDSYIQEAKQRKKEIIELMKKILSQEIVFWKTYNNTIVLKWKTKCIFINFKENIENKERYVIKMEIR